MNVKLEPMTEEIFNDYYNVSIKDYAKSHVKAGNWTEDEAYENAKKQFEQLLPNGLNTKNHILFSVVSDDEVIGHLWLFIQQKTTRNEAFIYDIALKESQRGKGFGTAVMEALNKYAKVEGIHKIGLHVFANNEPAIGLYKKMGFEITDLYMSKEIK